MKKGATPEKTVGTQKGSQPGPVKHTPGPWTIRGDVVEARDPTATDFKVTVGYIGNLSHNTRGDREQVKSNARLIAAAPELLEQLKRAVECVEYCRHKHKDIQHGTGYPIEIIWKELIAKAEGK